MSFKFLSRCCVGLLRCGLLKLVVTAVGRPAVGHVRPTWVWGEAGLGGAGIAPGGHVA